MRHFLLVSGLALVGALVAAGTRADQYRVEGPAGFSGYQLGECHGQIGQDQHGLRVSDPARGRACRN
jgi:hypothetical protein